MRKIELPTEIEPMTFHTPVGYSNDLVTRKLVPILIPELPVTLSQQSLSMRDR